MAEYVKTYTSEDLKPENIGKIPLALVDFWAVWCGPCRMMAPIVEELAAETPDVVFAKLNVDENLDIVQSLGIASIPTLILYKDGEAVERVIGVTPKEELKRLIDAHR